MTPALTVNLLRVLFVTFCGAIGGIITLETQGKYLPGIMIGVVFGLAIVLADRLLKGFSLRAFSSATFGLLLGLLYLATKRNLWVCAVAHGVNDTIAFALTFLF